MTFGPEACEYNNGGCMNLETGEYDPSVYWNTGARAAGLEFHEDYAAGWDGGMPEPTNLCAIALGTEEEASYNNYSTRVNHGGPAYMLPVIHSAKDPGVEFQLSTKATLSYRDPESGRCVGVRAVQTLEDGTEVEVNVHAVKAVVIAGGCWLSDQDLIEDYCGKWSEYNVLPLTIAEGTTALRLGIGMDGKIANGHSMWMMNHSPFGQNSFMCLATRAPMRFAIVVDENGNRFFCEDQYTPGACDIMASHISNTQQGKGKVWIVLSQEDWGTSRSTPRPWARGRTSTRSRSSSPTARPSWRRQSAPRCSRRPSRPTTSTPSRATTLCTTRTPTT